MHPSPLRALASATALATALVACGGGELLAIVSFVGSAGGDWQVDNPDLDGFQSLSDCGPAENEVCFVNIRRSADLDLYAPDFAVTYFGNLEGCPPGPIGEGVPPPGAEAEGTVAGDRITLPDCFTGRYVSINEALSDDGSIRAFFDSEVPNLTEGVWVEIQDEQRRFKFTSDPFVRETTDIAGCELTSPATTPASITVVAANIGAGRLQTELTLTVAGEVWSGSFVGISGMTLTRGTELLALQRRDLAGSC